MQYYKHSSMVTDNFRGYFCKMSCKTVQTTVAVTDSGANATLSVWTLKDAEVSLSLAALTTADLQLQRQLQQANVGSIWSSSNQRQLCFLIKERCIYLLVCQCEKFTSKWMQLYFSLRGTFGEKRLLWVNTPELWAHTAVVCPTDFWGHIFWGRETSSEN